MDALPEHPARALDRATRPAQCPEHGAYMSQNILRSVWSRCPACQSDEVERARRENDAERARVAEQYHRRMFDAVQIPSRFETCTFESFEIESNAMRRAVTILREYAETFDDPSQRGASLVLSGRPGTGKTHLVGAVLCFLAGRSVRYITAMDMIRAVRDTWRRDSERTESQVLEYLSELDLLVIDEVGMQYGTGGEQTILFDVLDRRYRELRPVILVTNQDRDGLKALIGDRVFDRLRETARWVPFDWEGWRGREKRAA